MKPLPLLSTITATLLLFGCEKPKYVEPTEGFRMVGKAGECTVYEGRTLGHIIHVATNETGANSCAISAFRLRL